LQIVLSRLEDMKAEDIVTIDLNGKSSIADFMVVASGRSNRHVGSVADNVVSELKKSGLKDIRVEGQPVCEWVLIDTGDVIVHVFRPETRDFYSLERCGRRDARAARRAEFTRTIMRVSVLAVGRMKKGPDTELAQRYLKRAEQAGRQIGLRAIEVVEIKESRASDAGKRMIEESIALANVIPEGAVTVMLDERGDKPEQRRFCRPPPEVARRRSSRRRFHCRRARWSGAEPARQSQAETVLRGRDLAAPDRQNHAAGADLSSVHDPVRTSLPPRLMVLIEPSSNGVCVAFGLHGMGRPGTLDDPISTRIAVSRGAGRSPTARRRRGVAQSRSDAASDLLRQRDLELETARADQKKAIENEKKLRAEIDALGEDRRKFTQALIEGASKVRISKSG
jgi:ribosome-associated protein